MTDIPRLVRIKRFTHGKYVGYWCLRSLGDPLGGWQLTKHYSKAGRNEQLVDSGMGFQTGVNRMIELMIAERDRIVGDFAVNEQKLLADVEGEKNGTLVPPDGFRTGYSARRLAQLRISREKNVRTWARDLAGIQRTLVHYGWPAPTTPIDSRVDSH